MHAYELEVIRLEQQEQQERRQAKVAELFRQRDGEDAAAKYLEIRGRGRATS